MAINFSVQVQSNSSRFSIPKGVLRQLDLEGGGLIYLVVKSPSGQELYRGVETLKSGAEIYGGALADAIEPGDQILVEASRSSDNGGGGQGQDWSKKEVAATVSDYFAMLNAELRGVKYSKAAHRKALLQLLSNRSAQAVEFKHCNVSAVLRDMNLTYIAGYKPRGNYQELLAQAVRTYLQTNGMVRKEVVEADANPLTAPPDGSQFQLADIEVPPPQPVVRPRKGKAKAVKTDWGAVNAYSRKLGEQGERFVLELEGRRLRDAGRRDLESKIEWVSLNQGDGAGFDIRSYDESGGEIFIEVKTTKGPVGVAFYVTANELRCSKERASAYKLYRLFHFGANPRVYRLSGSLASVLELEATVYRAACKGKAD